MERSQGEKKPNASKLWEDELWGGVLTNDRKMKAKIHRKKIPKEESQSPNVCLGDSGKDGTWVGRSLTASSVPSSCGQRDGAQHWERGAWHEPEFAQAHVSSSSPASFSTSSTDPLACQCSRTFRHYESFSLRFCSDDKYLFSLLKVGAHEPTWGHRHLSLDHFDLGPSFRNPPFPTSAMCSPVCLFLGGHGMWCEKQRARISSVTICTTQICLIQISAQKLFVKSQLFCL